MPSDNRVKTKKKARSKDTGQNGYEPRLKARYRDEILPALVKELGSPNPMQVPRMEKIVLNIGLGEALENAKAVESATRDLEAISGQHPIVTRARKSIANFKVREGNIVGIMVTLRGARMYEFLDRLVNASLPRIRDFRGLSLSAFDGRGNYSLGLREQTLFPEIDYDSMDRLRGLQISFVTSARTDNEAQRLLALMGMPFVRTEE
jgi:large subunit ribosomal protein L5